MEKQTRNILLGVGGAGALLLLLRGRSSAAPYLPDRPDMQPPVFTQGPTLTRQAARAMATAIFTAIYGSGGFWTGSTGEDEGAVIATIAQTNNDADVALLIDEYGMREGSWSTEGELDLPGTIVAYLSSSDRAEINAGFMDRGITFRF